MHFLKAAVVGAIASLFATLLLLSTAYARADERAPQSFNIGPQGLGAALNEFARESHEELLFAPDAVALKSSHGVRGTMEPLAALKILLTDSGLTYSTTPAGAILVGAPGSASALSQVAPSGAPRNPSQVPPPGSSLQLAQLDQAPAGPQISEENKGKKKPLEVLEEVVVTGTHIHGETDAPSPTFVYTREDIDRSGVSSTAEFVQLMTQNFGGVASENTAQDLLGGSAGATNQVRGTAVNLRGLGPDATLVLINGRRVAPGNTTGNWVDVSQIPLSAIERIEVVPDGASAIYGSDAVGGVVNFILRRDFDGAEAMLRAGTGSDGAPKDRQFSQLLGHTWRSGSALLSYEYDDRTALLARSRSFTDTAFEPTYLLPEEVRQGVLLDVNQSINDSWSVFGNGLYSHRTNHDGFAGEEALVGTGQSVIDAYTGTTGVRANLPRNFTSEVSTTYAKSVVSHIDTQAGALSADIHSVASVLSVDAVLSGPIWTMTAGDVKAAAGGHFRHETFDNRDTFAGTAFADGRRVTAGFAEFDVPIFGSADSPASNHMELSLAERYEHYSDFGGTSNPRAGLVWAPASGLKIRGTVGTSFAAPALYELNPFLNTYAIPQSDPRTGGLTNVLAVFGGNPTLKPQKATTWTAGVDFAPEYIEGLRTSFTYYDIRFRDRITNASGQGYNLFFNALEDEGALGPTIVQRNPPASLVEQLIANSSFQDFTGPGFTPNPNFSPSIIGAIADNRYLNLSTLSTSGLDMKISYSFDTDLGRFGAGFDGTYIFKYDYRFTSASATLSELSTVYNPVNLKFRTKLSYERGGFFALLSVNYTNSYTDNRISTAPVPIASWTTEDVTTGYTWKITNSALKSASLTFSVLNLTNASPPFIAANSATFPGLNFDAANANALGRYGSVQGSIRF